MRKYILIRLCKKAYLLIISGLIAFNLYGQTASSNPFPQLLFPSFSKSLLKMKDGRNLTATVNYNIVDEEMLFDQQGVYMVLEKPEEIDTVVVNGRKFVPVGKAFYEVVTKDIISIYIQHKGRYEQPGTPTAYGMTSKTAGPTKVLSVQVGNRIRQIDLPENVKVSPATVYWIYKDDKMQKFTTERQFLKLFPGLEDQIKKFIKSQAIDFKSEKDLVKLGNYCSELLLR